MTTTNVVRQWCQLRYLSLKIQSQTQFQRIPPSYARNNHFLNRTCTLYIARVEMDVEVEIRMLNAIHKALHAR